MNLNEAYIRIGFFSDQMKCICIFYTTMGVRHVKCTPKSNHACAGEFLLVGGVRPETAEIEASLQEKGGLDRSSSCMHMRIYYCIYLCWCTCRCPINQRPRRTRLVPGS